MDRKHAIEEGTVSLDRDEQEDDRLHKQMRDLIQILNCSNTDTNLEEQMKDEPVYQLIRSLTLGKELEEGLKRQGYETPRKHETLTHIDPASLINTTPD